MTAQLSAVKNDALVPIARAIATYIGIDTDPEEGLYSKSEGERLPQPSSDYFRPDLSP